QCPVAGVAAFARTRVGAHPAFWRTRLRIHCGLPNPSRSVCSRKARSRDWGAVMPIKIAVLGGSGYTALELLLILLRHPEVEIVAVTSRQEDSPRLDEVHPSLAGRLDLRLEPFDTDYLL